MRPEVVWEYSLESFAFYDVDVCMLFYYNRGCGRIGLASSSWVLSFCWFLCYSRLTKW